jgi:hypothetical protein
MPEREDDFHDDEYISLEVAREKGFEFVKDNTRHISVEKFINLYFDSETFSHLEAYHLCAVANFFPRNFKRKKDDEDTILRVRHIVISETLKPEKTYADLRNSFELFFRFNRTRIVERVAVVFGIKLGTKRK